MKQIIKKTANSDIPRSIIAILAGLIFLVIPRQISELLWVISAVFFIIIGLYELVRFLAVFISKRDISDKYGLVVVRAILMIVLGVALWRYHTLFVSITTIAFGLFFVFESIIEFLKCLRNREMNKPLRIFILIAASVAFVLGILIIIEPFEGIVTLIRITGAALVVSGTERIVSYVKSK